MPALEPSATPARRLSHSLSAKLTVLLLAGMVGVFALLGYLNLRLHRHNLEAAALVSAERVSDVIKRSTHYYMLRNDREALYHIIATMANEPGMVRIRIFNPDGRITLSTEPREVNSFVNKEAEACFACHAQAQPLTHLDRPDRFRIYRDGGGHRVLGIINPIENQPACSSADCHAHPPEQKILGVLDAHLSLASADAGLAESNRQMLAYLLAGALLIAAVSGLFVRRLVHSPMRKLQAGTERLARGELGYQLQVGSEDEVGQLAASFNTMSRELAEARGEVTRWAETLEQRVEQKTQELKTAQEQMLRAEKLASVGKLAAVVAHEINNPLAGILTYTKLLKKWHERDQCAARSGEVAETLGLVESESRRCGEIVRNLLMFARAAPMNLQWAALNPVVERCARLVRRQCELGGVALQLELAQDLPAVRCDPSQIEQVLLALTINSIEAMPRGGNLWLRTRSRPETEHVELEVRDDGAGIAAEHLSEIFEPFFTTKEGAHGTGLGLAVSRGIVERHNGRIAVASTLGRGTTFTVTLPVDASLPAHVPAEPQTASAR